MISIKRFIALVAVLFEVGVSNLQAGDQDAILEGAKKEGVLVVYTSMSVDQVQRILDAFKTRYPFSEDDHVSRGRRTITNQDHDRSASGKIRLRRRPISRIASLLFKKEKSAAKISIAGSEAHSKTVLRPGRVLDGSLYYAQRHRL